MYRTKPSIWDLAVALLIVAVAILMFCLPFFSQKGEGVIIKTATSQTEYSLKSNAEITVESNGHSLVVIINDGKVSVKSSDCRDGVCVNSGEISSVGQTIVCAPAGVVITIDGEGDVDHVAG